MENVKNFLDNQRKLDWDDLGNFYNTENFGESGFAFGRKPFHSQAAWIKNANKIECLPFEVICDVITSLNQKKIVRVEDFGDRILVKFLNSGFYFYFNDEFCRKLFLDCVKPNWGR